MPGHLKGFNLKYFEIFQRNIGLFTPEQQHRLETSSVTIVGPRSMCCVEALTLARFGVGEIRILIHPDENKDDNGTDLMGRPEISLAQAAGDTTPFTTALETRFDPAVPQNMQTFIQSSSIILDLLPTEHLNLKTILAAQARDAKLFHISAHPLNMGCVMFVFHPDGIEPAAMFQEMSTPMRESLRHGENAATAFLKAGWAATEAALILSGIRLESDLVLAPRFLIFNAQDRSFTAADC